MQPIKEVENHHDEQKRVVPKQRKKMDLISQIKYTLIFDEILDKKVLE